jgi:hypothetical protein
MLQTERSWVSFLMRSMDFSTDRILPAHCGPEVNSASNKKITRNLPDGKGQPACKGERPDYHLGAETLDNVGTLTYHNLMRYYGLLQR